MLAPGHLLAGTLECVAYCSIVGVGGKVRGNGVVGGLGKSKIDSPAGVHEVGNRLLLNECVGKVFRSHSGGVYSLNITGQNYPIREVVTPTPTNISQFF